MSRETFVMRNGELVPKSEAPPLHAAPVFIRDHMDPTWHPANGKMYDSKAAFRRATKDAGCIEVGTEPLKPREPVRMSSEQRGQDIKNAIEQLQAERR